MNDVDPIDSMDTQGLPLPGLPDRDAILARQDALAGVPRVSRLAAAIVDTALVQSASARVARISTGSEVGFSYEKLLRCADSTFILNKSSMH